MGQRPSGAIVLTLRAPRAGGNARAVMQERMLLVQKQITAMVHAKRDTFPQFRMNAVLIPWGRLNGFAHGWL